MIKPICQRYSTDCGVAGFAMLTDITYEAARNLLHPKQRWSFQRWLRPNYNYSVNYIEQKAAAKVLGYDLVWHSRHDKEFKIDLRFLKSSSLITVWTNPKNNIKNDIIVGTAHAVVWDVEAQKIIDPAVYRSYDIKYVQNNTVGYSTLKKR